jgi:hypothetical protein
VVWGIHLTIADCGFRIADWEKAKTNMDFGLRIEGKPKMSDFRWGNRESMGIELDRRSFINAGRGYEFRKISCHFFYPMKGKVGVRFQSEIRDPKLLFKEVGE